MQESKVKTLETTLQPYVEKLLEGLEKGAELVAENIPDILMQYVVYEAIVAWGIFILISIIIPFVIYRVTKVVVKNTEEEDMYLFNTLSIFTFFGWFQLPIAIKATFFPKLFLVSKFIEIF